MRLKQANSPFVILGITEDATDEDVRSAYKRLGMKFHPDRNTNPDAERRFKQIQMAYQMLKDEASRHHVIQILDLYRKHNKRAMEQPGTNSYNPEMFAADREEGDKLHVFGLVAEFFLYIYLASRLERVPFKMLIFMPYMMVVHMFDAAQWKVTPALIVLAFWQALIGSIITDVVVQAASYTERYYLRLRVNKVVGRIFIAATVILFYSIDVRGEAVFFFVGSNPDIIRAIAVLCMTMSAYFWVVLCLLFYKHHPTWEPIMVWLGVAGCLYYVFIILL